MYEISSPDKDNLSGNIKCRFCKSQNTVKKGFRATKKRGTIQRFICRDCKKSFCVNDGFFRMRNNEKIITRSVDSYLAAKSSRRMRDELKRHDETKISHVSILDWVRRYVLKVHKFVDSLKYQSISGKYYADETEIDCQKRNDKFWACIDWDSRMIVGTHYSLTANITEAKVFLDRANKKKRPLYVQTDSAQFYKKAFKDTFKGWWRKENGVEHIINNTYKTKKHNVRIETVFSKIKDRVRNFRGLKALWSAPILMAGIVLQHNFIEAHTTTGKFPCELAGLKLETEANRWLGLIRLACS